MQIFNQLNKLDLILGSQSPRRKSLLESAGFKFRTWAIPTPELYPPNLQPHEIALHLCQQKAEPFKNLLNAESIVITADTIVAKDQHILNKATTSEEAFRMITMLKGTSHEVITGVSITSSQYQKSFFEVTRVYFHELSDEEINWYITNFHPFDKAGAYGIQEWIGMAGVKKIEGCYYNVVGLPLAALYREMKIFLNDHF